MSRWESGRGYPEMEKIIFICNRYGVTMDDAVRRRSSPPAEAEAAEVEHRCIVRASTLRQFELSNLLTRICHPTTKASAIMLLTVIAMIGRGMTSTVCAV